MPTWQSTSELLKNLMAALTAFNDRLVREGYRNSDGFYSLEVLIDSQEWQEMTNAWDAVKRALGEPT